MYPRNFLGDCPCTREISWVIVMYPRNFLGDCHVPEKFLGRLYHVPGNFLGFSRGPREIIWLTIVPVHFGSHTYDKLYLWFFGGDDFKWAPWCPRFSEGFSSVLVAVPASAWDTGYWAYYSVVHLDK